MTVGTDDLYGFKHSCRPATFTVYTNIAQSNGDAAITARILAEPLTPRERPSLVNFADQCIFISGGRGLSDFSRRNDLYNVEKYDIKRNTWSKAPDLCIARMNHSSCVLDDTLIYTFCGYNS